MNREMAPENMQIVESHRVVAIDLSDGETGLNIVADAPLNIVNQVKGTHREEVIAVVSLTRGVE